MLTVLLLYNLEFDFRPRHSVVQLRGLVFFWLGVVIKLNVFYSLVFGECWLLLLEEMLRSI